MLDVVPLCYSISIIYTFNVSVHATVMMDTGIVYPAKITEIFSVENKQSSSAKTKGNSTIIL